MARRRDASTEGDATASEKFRDGSSGRTYRDGIEMVDDYIVRFGESVAVKIDPLDGDGFTDVKRGSATIGINVLVEHGVLLFLSRIMKVPTEGRERFYRRLLELNFLVTGDASFAIDEGEDTVYLRILRRIEGLDYEEFEDLLETIGRVADEWDDRLVRGDTSTP